MTITWESPVNEIVWESQTAPGITWTTVVGGTGGTEIPARRLLPNTVGTPGQTVAVNGAGTAVEYVDAPTGGADLPISSDDVETGYGGDIATQTQFNDATIGGLQEVNDTLDTALQQPQNLDDLDDKRAARENLGVPSVGGLYALMDFRLMDDGAAVPNGSNGDGRYDPVPEVTFAGPASDTPGIFDRNFSGFDPTAQLAEVVDGALVIRAEDWVSPTVGRLTGVVFGFPVPLANKRLSMRCGGLRGTGDFGNTSDNAEFHTEFADATGQAIALIVGYFNDGAQDFTRAWINSNVGGDHVIWSSDDLEGDQTTGVWALENDGATRYTVFRDGSLLSGSDGDFVDCDDIDIATAAGCIIAVSCPSFDVAEITPAVEWFAVTDAGVGVVSAGARDLRTSSGGSGDVVGPSSSTDGRAAEFDGTTGKLLKVAPLTGDGGRPKLDSDGTWADILIPSTIARDSEVAAAVLPKLSMPFLPTGEWSHCTPGATAVGNTPVSGGLIGWVLVYIPWSFDRLGLATTTGVASSTMRLGLYNIGTNGLPGTSILLPSGTLSVATSASTAEYTVSSGPLGWVAAVFQSASSGTPQVRTSSLGLAAQTYPFLQPRSNGTSNGLQFASRADAALPSDLTGFTWTSLTTGNWNMHQFRKA